MLNRCVKGISAVGTKHPLPLCSANQRRCSRPCNKTALYTLREVFSRRGYLSRIKRRRSLPERHGTHGRHTGHEHHEHDLQATKDGQRITAIGLGANVLLSVAKAAAGYFGNSTALIADAAHSLGDLFSDFVTLATHKIARKSPAGSSTFSYGFGKFEAIGSASVALMLLSSGAGVAYHSILQVFSETAGVPTSTALYVAAASVIVKEVLYQATMIIAKQQQSSVLMANAWHHRSDALSSILACIGVAGQMLGVPKLDAVAGFAVAAVIIRAGYPILKEAVIELADGDPFGTVKRQATEYLNSIDRPHVSSHQVRIRKLGPYLAIEAVVELDLEKYRETKQAIACIETIKEKLKARFPAARFISVRDQQLEICGTKLKLLPWLRLNLAPTTSM